MSYNERSVDAPSKLFYTLALFSMLPSASFDLFMQSGLFGFVQSTIAIEPLHPIPPRVVVYSVSVKRRWYTFIIRHLN